MPKYGRKIWHLCGHGVHTSEGPYLPINVHMPPWWGPSEAIVRMWNEWGINVDGQLVYPVAPHSRCVAIGIFHGSCLGGSLTLINIASFMVLVMLLDSLHTMKKLPNLMAWPMVKMGEGTLRCSLYLSPKVLPVSPIIIKLIIIKFL